MDALCEIVLDSKYLCKFNAKKINEMRGVNLENSLVKNRIFIINSIRSRILPFTSNNQPSSIFEKKIENIGAKIGLNKREIRPLLSSHSPITGQVLPPPSSPFSKFCASTVLFIIIAFILFIAIFWETVPELPHPTYTPGTRYGALKPNDFR